MKKILSILLSAFFILSSNACLFDDNEGTFQDEIGDPKPPIEGSALEDFSLAGIASNGDILENIKTVLIDSGGRVQITDELDASNGSFSFTGNMSIPFLIKVFTIDENSDLVSDSLDVSGIVLTANDEIVLNPLSDAIAKRVLKDATVSIDLIFDAAISSFTASGTLSSSDLGNAFTLISEDNVKSQSAVIFKALGENLDGSSFFKESLFFSDFSARSSNMQYGSYANLIIEILTDTYGSSDLGDFLVNASLEDSVGLLDGKDTLFSNEEFQQKFVEKLAYSLAVNNQFPTVDVFLSDVLNSKPGNWTEFIADLQSKVTEHANVVKSLLFQEISKIETSLSNSDSLVASEVDLLDLTLLDLTISNFTAVDAPVLE